VLIHDRPAMQAWTDGLVAVLDAVGSECVSVFAMSEWALPVMLLTASGQIVSRFAQALGRASGGLPRWPVDLWLVITAHMGWRRRASASPRRVR